MLERNIHFVPPALTTPFPCEQHNFSQMFPWGEVTLISLHSMFETDCAGKLHQNASRRLCSALFPTAKNCVSTLGPHLAVAISSQSSQTTTSDTCACSPADFNAQSFHRSNTHELKGAQQHQHYTAFAIDSEPCVLPFFLNELTVDARGRLPWAAV